VEVNHLGAAAAEDRSQVGGDAGMARGLHDGTRMRELELDRVPAEDCRLTLLVAADALHLLVGEVRVGAGAGRTGAVGHDDTPKRLARRFEAVGDAGVRHDLDVVLMRAEAKVRDPREGLLGGGSATGHEDISLRIGEFHRKTWGGSAPERG